MIPPVSLQEILQPSRIAAAWEKLRSNDGAAGEDSVTIRELEEPLPHVWPSIEESIRSGSYQPSPLWPVQIPKPAGGTRKLAIPSVIDRLVQHAITGAITPRWESRFPRCSYAYRQGVGTCAAINGVLSASAIIKGPVALRMDIRDFFDRIPPEAISSVLRMTPCDEDSCRLIERSVHAPLATPLGPVSSAMGIPQGSPLSPLLSNAVLLPFDLSFSSAPASLFRYADDMLVLCRDEATARVMLNQASEVLAGIGLELNANKTRIAPLDQTSFLGFGFVQEDGRWHRGLSDETRAACVMHLRRMEYSGKSPAEMVTFLRQWAAYFLPSAEDRIRHGAFVRELCSSFRLNEPDISQSSRSSPPPGFSYSGGSSAGGSYPRLPWALRFMMRRIRFGLNFQRRGGFMPVPTGFHVTIAGHRIHIRL